MKRSCSLACILFLLLTLLPLTAAGERPNFVVVLIDDMGWGDFSCFGNSAIETVHVDRLASEGMRFSQFYVNSPICSPSRTALTTGQYPHRWRINSFLNNRKSNEERDMAQWLDVKAPTLARHLKKAGYSTGHFGKWHMGGQRDVGEAPMITEYGFDETLTNFEGLGPRLLPLCNAFDGKPLRKHALGSDRLGRGPVVWMDRAKITEGFVGAALEFIKTSAAAKQSFYINLWPDDVHSPFFPPEDRRGDGSNQALYHGVLQTMDEQLGVLFDHIRNDPQLRENTIVLVCSDNGPEPGAGSAGPFRGAKTMLYEGGVRSPLIVWAPGFIAPEKTGTENRRSMFSAIDLVPSILTLAQGNIPAGVFDGENVSEALLGKADVGRKAPLYWRRPPDRPGENGEDLPDLAVRSGKWKFLCEYDGSNPQLYDLSKDQAESTNLADQQAKVVSRLSRQLLAWYEAK
jgi:arylsulfatase A-like enzyme